VPPFLACSSAFKQVLVPLNLEAPNLRDTQKYTRCQKFHFKDVPFVLWPGSSQSRALMTLRLSLYSMVYGNVSFLIQPWDFRKCETPMATLCVFYLLLVLFCKPRVLYICSVSLKFM
jgi:hypothetical protein